MHLVLLLSVALAVLGGSQCATVPDQAQNTWIVRGLTLHPSLALTRNRRDVANVGDELGEEYFDVQNVTYSNFTEVGDFMSPSDECIQMLECQFSGRRGELNRIMNAMNFSDLFPAASEACPTLNSCRKDECKQEDVQMNDKIMDTLYGWICEHKQGFQEADQCFQQPFPEQMSQCVSMAFDHDHERPTRASVKESMEQLRKCFGMVLSDLPLCRFGDKAFFMSFFNFIYKMRMEAGI